MRSKVIRQSVSEESLFGVINDWCRQGAGQRKCRLRILSAFASGSGVGAISPLVDIFLADGNSLQFIIGIDREGTDRGAIRHLDALVHAYPHQCKVSIFNAPASNAIFHPKLYIFNALKKVSVVLGSANLTGGGLASNFESLIHYQACDGDCPVVHHAEEIWSIFANPQHPLCPQFLKPLTVAYGRSLLAKLPEKSSNEGLSEKSAFKNLWRPLSRITLPSSTLPKRRTQSPVARPATKFLVMDVLTETRNTQMQIPLPVVESFFGIGRSEPRHIRLSIVTKTGLSQPIERPIVISQGQHGRRLMRRLEMPQIREMDRPLVAVFLKLPGRDQFAFKLLAQGSRANEFASRLLDQEGQQGNAQRRFLIGQPSQKVWRQVKRLLKP